MSFKGFNNDLSRSLTDKKGRVIKKKNKQKNNNTETQTHDTRCNAWTQNCDILRVDSSKKKKDVLNHFSTFLDSG